MHYILVAFLSALLFGASTPIAKTLLHEIPPFTLAGLLYLGAALGVFPLRRKHHFEWNLVNKANRLRILGAIVFGGIIGPVLLLFGLQQTSASSVALWLNLELVATALLGFFIFNDHLGKSGWIAVLGIVLSCTLLTYQKGQFDMVAFLLVGSACICWGLDNHLTALIDGIIPRQSTFVKGLIAGTCNLTIGIITESPSFTLKLIMIALVVGAFAYGISISLYISAAQHLGATRSQMIFASAPFFGVILAVLFLGDSFGLYHLFALTLLIVSLIFLLRDKHSHSHQHNLLHHKHLHSHGGLHHNHDHVKEKTGIFHTHWHTHGPTTHSHPHWPDVHHRHKH